jgi:4-oxalocrotonate tautomerase
MPLIRIDLVRGRDKKMLLELMAEVTATASRVLHTPADRVRVVINEVDPDLWGIGGVPYSVARAGGSAATDATPSAAPSAPTGPDDGGELIS